MLPDAEQRRATDVRAQVGASEVLDGAVLAARAHFESP